MAVTPTSPRQTCISGRVALNPVRRSPRRVSHRTITGMAKNERKNTACPAGTSVELALMSEAMIVNRKTEASFSAMPRIGDM